MSKSVPNSLSIVVVHNKSTCNIAPARCKSTTIFRILAFSLLLRGGGAILSIADYTETNLQAAVMRNFFVELKRRHVYRVAVYYAAGAWLLVQVADVVLENFDLPAQVMQIILYSAALGFPVALILAWIFDATPAGIRRTAATDESPEGGPEAASVVPAMARTEEERPGLVVLPFDSMSESPQDKIVSDGFTEDLTTSLARVPGFFVISRNTAFSYRGKQKDLREIGRELGVRYLLEGSLRRMGEQMRITAQLIEAETGSHLWAENYDTPVDQMDRVQDELINAIAVQLGSELARAEFKLTRRQSPSDMDAWSLYQSAKGKLMFMGWSKTAISEAAVQLRKAIALDPTYAAPQAYLALLLALGHWIKLVDDPGAAHDESVAAAAKALELDPNSSEVLGYVGCAFSDLGYKERGLPLLERAMDLDASNAQAKAAYGAALIVSGELESGIAALSEAVKISPRDPGLAMWATILTLGSVYSGDVPGAQNWCALAYKSDPNFFPILVLKAWIQSVQGEPESAQASLNEASRLFPDLDEKYIGGFMGGAIAEQLRSAGLNIPSAQA
jgi:adenylate cyclase